MLLVRLYILSREMAERDAWLFAVESSETLARLRRQIRLAYRELAAVSPGCRTLCEVAYSSIPGWCVRCRYAVPGWYYRGGCYVGPVLSARYAGAYSVRAYGAYHDRGSRHDWRDGGKYFHENIGRTGKGAHGGRHHNAAAKKHLHPKSRHGMARPPQHGRASKTGHGSRTAAAKNSKHSKTNHGAARSTKHRRSPPAARHRSPRSKSSPHSQPHRQRPKQGARAPKGRAAAHLQHARHGQPRHKAGYARHK